MKRITVLIAAVSLGLFLAPASALAAHHEKHENPCAAKKNPCDAKKKNPCDAKKNPCEAENPCAAKKDAGKM